MIRNGLAKDFEGASENRVLLLERGSREVSGRLGILSQKASVKNGL
jgi:hypothetical protein